MLCKVRAELDADARILDWKATLASLVTAIHPWRVRLALTILLGVGRVTAFIGVGVLGAWLVSALRAGDPHQAIAAYLLLVAPLAAVLHWLESWLAHDMAYRLLADLRIRLFRQLDRLAPGYLLRRRSGDLVTLATQDVETIEYFYAHTVAPAVVAVLVPAAVITVLATAAWPLALGLLPFLAYAMLSPVRGRSRIDVLGSKARESLGLLGAHMTETIQGLSDLLAFQATGRRREAFMALARIQRDPARTAGGSGSTNCAAGCRYGPRRIDSRHSRRVAGLSRAAFGGLAADADSASRGRLHASG